MTWREPFILAAYQVFQIFAEVVESAIGHVLVGSLDEDGVDGDIESLFHGLGVVRAGQ